MHSKEIEKKFTKVYEQYSEAIFRHCYYRVFDREKAKDVMQEAFYRTWDYIVKGNTIENIRAFVYKTANNIIIDESRKRKGVSLDKIMEEGFTPNIDPRQSTEDYFSAKEVIEIVNSLDEKYRDVIILRYIDGFSLKEIAQIKKEKDNNIYIRLHRGIKQIKEIIEAKENPKNKKT